MFKKKYNIKGGGMFNTRGTVGCYFGTHRAFAADRAGVHSMGQKFVMSAWQTENGSAFCREAVFAV